MIKATVTGLDELRRELEKLKQGIPTRAVRNSLAAAAATIRDDAKSRAPVLSVANAVKAKYRKPGTVRNAIGVVRPDPKTLPPGVLRVSVKVRPAKEGRRGARSRHDPFYAYFLEFGTKFMSPRPFMGPAGRNIGRALSAFTAKLASEIKRLGGD